MLDRTLLRSAEFWVAKVSKVVIERETRPGTLSTSSQKENQEIMTINEHGKYDLILVYAC